jgi:CelD/BcsL family acetyltransferase involved in cellulose biosynthesis
MSTLLRATESAAGAPAAGSTVSPGNPFIADVSEGADAVEPFLARCAPLQSDSSLPFHSPNWLRAWYATFGCSDGRRAVLVAVRLQGTATDAVLLPLAARRQRGFGGISVVEFADAGVVDYVAPLLARHWHGSLPPEQAAVWLWQAVKTALRGHDLLHIHKMLPRLLPEDGGTAGGRPNPLAAVLRTEPCAMFGNQFSVASDSDWDTWRHSLDKRVRKEIERCWRVFQRSPLARFEHATDPAQALALFETLEQQQSQRMQALQPDYKLDAPACRAFYRQVIAGGVADGQVVLTALKDGDTVVSALFGLANGQRYIGLRQSLGGDAWKTCSPARLLDEQTARVMHGLGRQHFDFGIGDYHHKQALQMTSIPLLDACQALSVRGMPAALAWRLRRRLKEQSWLVRWVRSVAAWRKPRGPSAH